MSFRPKVSFQTKQTRYLGVGAGGRRTLIAGSRCLLGSFLFFLILSLAIASVLRSYILASGFFRADSRRQQPAPAAVDTYQKKKFFSVDILLDGCCQFHLSSISNLFRCAVRKCSVVISSRISSSRCDDLPAFPPAPNRLIQLSHV